MSQPERKWWYAWEVAEQVQLHKMSDEMLTPYAAVEELDAHAKKLEGDNVKLFDRTMELEREVERLRAKLASAVEALEKISFVPVAANGLPLIAAKALAELKEEK